MTRSELYKRVTEYFLNNMPQASTELKYDTPFSLLVAVILSAQCTDKRVNQITPALLNAYPDAQSMSEATENDIFEYIKSCSYPNSKAHHLHQMSIALCNNHNGIVPQNFDELIKLPGVGRKTANVMISVAFGQQAIAVDTHVFRVSARIGLTQNAHTPREAEEQLTKGFKHEYWSVAHHWLILHGRYVCKALKPQCTKCGLTDLCQHFKKQI